MSDDMMLLGMLTRRAADHNADVRDFRTQINKLEDHIRKLQAALIAEQANGAGLTAVMRAFKAKHPDSPLMKATGLRYKESGNDKLQYALVYEEEFDKKARELGVKQPERIRAT